MASLLNCAARELAISPLEYALLSSAERREKFTASLIHNQRVLHADIL